MTVSNSRSRILNTLHKYFIALPITEAVNSTSLSAFTIPGSVISNSTQKLKLLKDLLLAYMPSVPTIRLAWTNLALTGVTTRKDWMAYFCSVYR